MELPVSGTWDEWKKQLAKAVAIGQNLMGMSQQEIAARAEKVGDFLAQNIDPNSPEQRVLKELWEVGDQQEQRSLASMLVKLVSKTPALH